MATSASDYQQSDTAERSGFIVDAVSDDVGKGIFATKEFAAGETLFRERPLVSAQEIMIPIELHLQNFCLGFSYSFHFDFHFGILREDKFYCTMPHCSTVGTRTTATGAATSAWNL